MRLGAWAGALVLSLAAFGTAVAAPPKPTPTVAAESTRKVLVLLRLPPAHYRGGSDYSDAYGDELGRSARRRIGAQLARAEGLKLETDWAIPLLGVDCLVMAIPDGRSEAEVAASIARDKRVAWAQPMKLFHAQGGAAQPDPLLAAQPAAQAWRLLELHEIATGENVRVAVIDSGIDAGHPDLTGQVRVQRDFVAGRAPPAERHGTAVAGIIAARADNGVGIVGVAPGARLLGLRACSERPAQPSGAVCDSLSLAKALEFAITNKAQVVNLSWTGPPDILLGRLLDVALSRGITVVGASNDALARGGFPASHPGVIAAAQTQAGARASGAYVAPGRDVPTTQPGGRWALVSGNSYSAAHISGLLALARQRSARPGARVLVVRAGRTIDACATLLQTDPACRSCCAGGAARTAAR
ncbi:S8 family serine peptidase [Phenylobacterium sp. LjRoot219]|uniref:S8 family peptidase n=1 Tax=Phenylobacterium sp. LjRoot219 TaxID=3342283 RepID=UPI003ECEFB2C